MQTHLNKSTLDLIASLPRADREYVLDGYTLEEIFHLWRMSARKDQVAPEGDWLTWLMLAGRGAGKTRAGAEWIRERVKAGAGRIGLIAPTAADARDVMVEGPSGLLSVCAPWDVDWRGSVTGRPLYEPSKRRVTWDNGAVATLFTADEPDRLRGPQHDTIWADELAAWNRLREAWDMAQFGLRLSDGQGKPPRQCVTTTPRPLPLVRELIKDPRTVVSRASTYDNAKNLAPAYLDALRAKYEGTRLGRQEIAAEILDDTPGALWTRSMIEAAHRPAPDQYERIVVGVDPSGSDGETGDSQGIIVAGRYGDEARVIEDCTVRLGPDGWGRACVSAYHRHKADRIVAERNYGGEMVRAVIQSIDPDVPVTLVTATRGKHVRAEPIAALYEQGRVSHGRDLAQLEDQMCAMTTTEYTGEGSPDRLDAMVWAMTDLMIDAPKGVYVW